MNFNVAPVDLDLNTVTTRCQSSGPWDRGWMGHAGGPHPKDRKARKGRVSFAAILDRNRSNLARTETRECTASRCPRRNRVPMDSAFNIGKARDRKVQDPKARAHGVQGNTLRLTRLPCRAGLSAI